jgi:hypothetical protein
MENPETRSQDATDADESVEEFRDDVENDPSTADAQETEDTDLDRLRGG